MHYCLLLGRSRAASPTYQPGLGLGGAMIRIEHSHSLTHLINFKFWGAYYSVSGIMHPSQPAIGVGVHQRFAWVANGSYFLLALRYHARPRSFLGSHHDYLLTTRFNTIPVCIHPTPHAQSIKEGFCTTASRYNSGGLAGRPHMLCDGAGQ